MVISDQLFFCSFISLSFSCVSLTCASTVYFFLSCDGVAPPLPHISHCQSPSMGIVGPRIDPQGELGVCVFLWGHRIFALQRSSAYDMGKSNRFGMEIRERNNLLHGTVLIVFFSSFVYFYFSFQGLLFYVSPLEGHLYLRCTTYPLWDLLSIYVREAYSLHFN